MAEGAIRATTPGRERSDHAEQRVQREVVDLEGQKHDPEDQPHEDHTAPLSKFRCYSGRIESPPYDPRATAMTEIVLNPSTSPRPWSWKPRVPPRQPVRGGLDVRPHLRDLVRPPPRPRLVDSPGRRCRARHPGGSRPSRREHGGAEPSAHRRRHRDAAAAERRPGELVHARVGPDWPSLRELAMAGLPLLRAPERRQRVLDTVASCVRCGRGRAGLRRDCRA